MVNGMPDCFFTAVYCGAGQASVQNVQSEEGKPDRLSGVPEVAEKDTSGKEPMSGD